MKPNYTYVLEKYMGRKTRFTCPNCGNQYCFVRYIDYSTGERLPAEVGICDHRNSCGYKYTAGDYFRKNPEERSKYNSLPPVHVPVKPPSFIPPTKMYPTIYNEDRNKNNFYKFLVKLFGKNTAYLKMIEYNIGTSSHWPSANIFWQVDSKHQVRSGKIMLLNPTTGKRVHGKENWIHSVYHIPDFNLSQCMFGEHLLDERSPLDDIGIVEGEKTAVIASHFIPNMIWLATGGLGLFNPGTHQEKFKVLNGRTVILFPDLGVKKPNRETPYEEWSRKNDLLRHLGANSVVSDFLEKRATEENRIAGEDIADFLIREHQEKSKNRGRDTPV